MVIRFRETWGSWRGSQPGTRHWRSRSVSYGLFDGLLVLPGLGIWYLVLLPFLVFPLWLSAEFYVLGISAIVVVSRWIFDPSTRFSARFRRWGWLWYLSAT